MNRCLPWLPLLVTLCAACGSDEPDPGALIAVTMDSKVGVLLDEFPGPVRERFAQDLLARPKEFWIARAKLQLRLTVLRLNFRATYFNPGEKGSLPLPPEEKWLIIPDPNGAKRERVDNHDLVTITYSYQGTLVSDPNSPAQAEPMLASAGGKWDEQFVFPVDPTLLLQRTGYACMDEDQYPPQSVDAENAFLFYDDTCEVETPDSPGCHYTLPEPIESCPEAVSNHVGHVNATLHFERLSWDKTKADMYRSGEITHTDGPDLKVLTSGLQVNRVIYRYFAADDCAMADGCIGAPGWRRLITFDSHDQNVGGQALHIGDIDYFIEHNGSDNSAHGMYEYSACHNHYHFKYYGDFAYGSGAGEALAKNGFCLESTDRLSNNETTPIMTPYSDCTYQGVEAGWGDLYQAGLTCNWVDVTSIDTSGGALTDSLSFHSNPDGFLCEGSLVKDAEGNIMWEATEYTTSDGKPVERMVCNQFADASGNDVGSIQLTLPQEGGMLTTACQGDDFGPRRNCGFSKVNDNVACNAGSTVNLSCSVSDGGKPVVVRVCEHSVALGTGVDCEHSDALVNQIVDGTNVQVAFDCPAGRDDIETGGAYSLYAASLYSGDTPVQNVTCR